MSAAAHPAADVETVGADDIAVVTTSPGQARGKPNADVMSAVRYLLYRYELTNGSLDLPRTIAVVGGSPGDGVTTVSRSLAEVLAAERNGRVCWVDFDSSQLSSPDSIRPIEISRFDHKPVGIVAPPNSMPTPSNSLAPLDGVSDELTVQPGAFARPELDAFVDRLANGYRHIVFDTPPLLSRPDSIGLLRRADAYILVARHGTSSLNDIRRISDEMRSIPSLGAVLNAQRIRTPRFLRRLVTG